MSSGIHHLRVSTTLKRGIQSTPRAPAEDPIWGLWIGTHGGSESDHLGPLLGPLIGLFNDLIS